MKGVKPTAISSVFDPTQCERNTLSLDGQLVPPSLNRGVRISLEKKEADHSSSRRVNPSEEEHRRRLVCLGEKVGRLAHDIRHPLSSIEWFATLLGRDHDNLKERQELVDHCIRAVRSLDHLVANMLVFSAPLHTEREPVNLLSLLDDVELLAVYPLRKKRLTIHRHHEGHVSIIHGHEPLLKQALLNVLINAIHASEPDTTIEIHCRRASGVLEQDVQPPEDGVILRIRDHGCGMSEEDRSHMFRPFYSNRKGGTGLGLSIVQQIVHLHHGLIDITSQQGKGTTVDLFFPQ
ncbi:MAG: ATP-binding protein [Nitrospirales bacterium]